MGDHLKEETYSGFKYNDPFFNINWPYKIKVISERDNSFQILMLIIYEYNCQGASSCGKALCKSY